MAKRLQVILQDAEYREIQRVARARRMSIAEWVRQALASARRYEPLGDTGKKLDTVREAARQNFRPPISIRCWPRSSAVTRVASVDTDRLQLAHVSDRLTASSKTEHSVARILSFDAGFDGVPGVTRLR